MKSYQNCPCDDSDQCRTIVIRAVIVSVFIIGPTLHRNEVGHKRRYLAPECGRVAAEHTLVPHLTQVRLGHHCQETEQTQHHRHTRDKRNSRPAIGSGTPGTPLPRDRTDSTPPSHKRQEALLSHTWLRYDLDTTAKR